MSFPDNLPLLVEFSQRCLEFHCIFFSFSGVCFISFTSLKQLGSFPLHRSTTCLQRSRLFPTELEGSNNGRPHPSIQELIVSQTFRCFCLIIVTKKDLLPSLMGKESGRGRYGGVSVRERGAINISITRELLREANLLNQKFWGWAQQYMF